MNVTELLALGGVLLSAGAALERMRRIEGSNKSQGERIGRLEDLVTELRTERRVLEGLERRPSTPRPHRALGAPADPEPAR
jgi:hypothetical protein